MKDFYVTSSGWLLGIFQFRYWTGGGQFKKSRYQFCGSIVTERWASFSGSHFVCVIIWMFVPLAKIHRCSDANRLLSVKRLFGNSGKLCEEFLNYGSSPTVLVFVHPCSHRSYELSQVSFTVLFFFVSCFFFESWMPQSKNSPSLLSWELCEEQ